MENLTMNNSPILPFGKYKGRSIEEVEGEQPGYLIWLYEQPWSKETYPAVYNYIKRHLREIREYAQWDEM